MLPPRLNHLAVYEDRPVPFTTFVDDKGTPDWGCTDYGKWQQALQRNLCGLCGEPHDYWLVLVGTEKSIEKRQFFDAPMHKECARYVAENCPHFLEGLTSGDRVVRINNEAVVVPMPEPENAPTRMGLYLTRSYKVTAREDKLWIVPAPAKEIDWIDGRDV